MDHRVDAVDGTGQVGWAAHVASGNLNFRREVR